MNIQSKIFAYIFASLMLQFSFQCYMGAVQDNYSKVNQSSRFDLYAFDYNVNSSPAQKQNSDRSTSESSEIASIILIGRLFDRNGLSELYDQIHLSYFINSRLLDINLKNVIIVFPFHHFG